MVATVAKLVISVTSWLPKTDNNDDKGLRIQALERSDHENRSKRIISAIIAMNIAVEVISFVLVACRLWLRFGERVAAAAGEMEAFP